MPDGPDVQASGQKWAEGEENTRGIFGKEIPGQQCRRPCGYGLESQFSAKGREEGSQEAPPLYNPSNAGA